MKLTVLVDNNTIIDRYFLGEPGVSYFIQDDNYNILFDTGYSDVFIKNAYKMNIDINNINSIVISHGHNDHTWGLPFLIKHYSESTRYNKPKLIAHPMTFLNKWVSDAEDIGSMVSEEKLKRHFEVNLSKNPVWLTDKVVFLGEIERKNDFENKLPIGKMEHSGGEIDDYVLDDSALVYRSAEGLVIITGCSHSGICNIIEYAKKVCSDDRIVDVIGGFHLLNPSREVITKTCEYMKQNNINKVHAGHCTDLKSKIELSKVTNIKEIGVGLTLEYI
ncbi:beta-lactamase [Clostridium sp. DMHC 10]|uniref:MBL fold metallo-hydrolase n=1 Tax=Clostridium sp. DMHC 10 TaxID=747377 RepID=UPI00069E4773|nr:MBL fold metallo-hydrolase [Clostridium sp. DMHC 10]KOF56578.1 beta-lactamase [Clostridium sp. DMHC 10]